MFFSAANPCMRFGGLIAYSKSEVTKLVPRKYLPHTIYVNANSDKEGILRELGEKGMSLPLIIKPDVGERGKGVKILRTTDELNATISSITDRMLIQTFENLPLELGVLYSRHPEEAIGKITSVVIKEFPVVIGNGKSTLQELILANIRTRLSYKVHFKRFQSRLKEVPNVGEKIQVVSIGNHMLGTTFNSGNHLITDKLTEMFDSLSKQIDGFFIGRFDVRTNSIADLEKGDFKVIEVNGVNSEPCHIFHPGRSIFLAWRDLFKHWKRIADISIANHKNGVSYASYSEIRAEIKRHNAKLDEQL